MNCYFWNLKKMDLYSWKKNGFIWSEFYRLNSGKEKKNIQVKFTNCSKWISLIQIIKYMIMIQFFESNVCVLLSERFRAHKWLHTSQVHNNIIAPYFLSATILLQLCNIVNHPNCILSGAINSQFYYIHRVLLELQALHKLHCLSVVCLPPSLSSSSSLYQFFKFCINYSSLSLLFHSCQYNSLSLCTGRF